MTDLVAALEALDAALAEVASAVLAGDTLRSERDEIVLSVVGLAARIARRAEGLLIEGVCQVDERSDVGVETKMTARYGCRSVSELLQRVARVSSRSAADIINASSAVQRRVAPSSGDVMPADYPAMREAMAAGAVGVGGLVAVTVPLSGVLFAAGRATLLAADEELAAVARGEGADGAPAASADELRALATVWAMYFDQDGAEPREKIALRKRGLTLGRCRDGLVPVRGGLLPEVAGQLQLVFDSILNPKVEGSEIASGPRFVESDDPTAADELAVERTVERIDGRSRAQKQHDAFAAALAKVAGSGLLPTLGGAAPTLVVSAREEDLTSGHGYAHIDGCDEPVSIDVARRVACTGGIQRVVLDDASRIVSIATVDRAFNYLQRRAIALRDGGCVIPGCRVPASWCEIHHVREHSQGGPTETGNGVMLCWWHHRSLETSGWQIRMNHGVPEVRGATWWDLPRAWRPATKSPTRMRERIARRT